MSDEQMEQLVEIARNDTQLGSTLKDREINQFNPDGSPKLPSLSMLVDEFVQRECGHNHNYAVGLLIMRLRKHARTELGLSV